MTPPPSWGTIGIVHPPSEAERQQLILEHYVQVKRIALGFSRRLPVHIELDDLIGWGLLGLLQAVEHRDASRPLAPLVELYVRGAIVDVLRQQGIRRSVLLAGKTLDQCGRTLQKGAGPRPSQGEVAGALGLSGEGLARLRHRAQAPTAVRGPEIWEDIAADHEPVEDRLFAHQRRAQLQEWVQQLKPREQTVIRGRLEGKKWTEIAAGLGVTEGRVSQLYQSATENLLRLAGAPAGRRSVQAGPSMAFRL